MPLIYDLNPFYCIVETLANLPTCGLIKPLLAISIAACDQWRVACEQQIRCYLIQPHQVRQTLTNADHASR